MKHLRAVLSVLTLFLAACGGDTNTSPMPSNLTGTWSGTTTTDTYGTEQTTFIFSQAGNQVTGTLVVTGTESLETTATGTVNGGSATISALFGLNNGGTVTYQYQGTVTDTTFGGTVTLIFSKGRQETGQFSVTKGADASLTPPTQPAPPTTPTPPTDPTSSPVIHSFTANPSEIAPGESATLSWNVTGERYVLIDFQEVPRGATSITVSPTETTTYLDFARHAT